MAFICLLSHLCHHGGSLGSLAVIDMKDSQPYFFLPIWARNLLPVGNFGSACVIQDQRCQNFGISHYRDPVK